MVALPNTKIDSTMIEEFSSPIFEAQNHNKYMFVDENGRVIYKDVTALIDDINDDGGIIGTNNKVVIRDWEPNYEYQEKETITHNNAIWKCVVRKSQKPEFDPNDWKMLAGYSKSSEFFYDAENEIEEIVLEEEVASKGAFLINVNNLLLQSNNYSLGDDNKTITFVNPIPKDTQIEVIVYGNMIMPTNVDNVVTKTYTTIADGETEFFLDEPAYKKDLITVNVENTVLLQSEWTLNEATDKVTLLNGVPAGTRVQIQYFNNLDLSIGATFTPHVSKVGRVTTITWTNDQELPNPDPVNIYDGITYTPSAEKVGRMSTISWTNDGGQVNPQTLNIFDGATFVPHVTKSNYTTTVYWTNDGSLPNPSNVQILDGINYIPTATRDDNEVIISWENDQGAVNPDDAVLYDGTTFTPTVRKVGKTTTISWTNDGGKQNPDTVQIIDGSTFTPSSTRSGSQVIISWTNDGGLPNPQNVSLNDGATYTPQWTKTGHTANISWTNNAGLPNPQTLQLFDGVTFTPHTSKTGSRTTIYWTNDQGAENPDDSYIFDGTTFTPHITDGQYTNKILSWTNDGGKQNPPDSILIGGTTFTPAITNINAYTNRLSWTNDGGKSNPSNLDIINGVNYTPVATKNNYTTTIAWTNDQGKTNPTSVEIKDGIIYLPNTVKSGIKTTLSWTNDQGAGNPPSTVISDGATFTPSVTKVGKVVTIAWSNNDNLPNPSSVQLTDGVNYTPVISKNGYTTTLGWTNDSGLPNPANSYIYDGATFTPHSSKSGIVTTITWTNEQGLENPNSFDISDGTTFTPRVVKTNYITTISWSNDGGKANPATVQVTDGINWTPHITKDDVVGTTVLSWTNDQGAANPDPVEIYDGKVNDVLLNGTSIVTNRVASFTLGTMAQEDKDDYVLLTTYNTKVAELEQAIDDEETRAKGVEGDLTQLSTTDKTDLVSAINEVVSDTSDLSDDLQDEITRATTAEGVLQDNIDAEELRATTAESTLQDNIDAEETRAKGVEGTLSNLTTDAKTNLVSAINEVDAHTDTNATNLANEITRATGVEGTLSNLTTDAKTNLVSAINEVDAHIDNEITRATGVEGTLSNLTTDAKTNLVAAINEVDAHTDTNATNLSNHIADTSNPHQVTKAQVGLGNVDNTSDLNKPISTATQTALDGKVDKVNTAKRVYGTDASGNQTTYDYDSFGKVDDVKVAGTSVVTNKIANLGSMASETASDYTKTADLADIALSGSWNDLDDTPTTIAGYGITDAYTKTEVDGLVASTFRYKGSVNTYSQLPTTGQVVGDVWNVATADTTHGIKAGDNVCWDGSNWDVLAGVTDLSVYDNHIANTSNPHQVTKAQVGLGNVDNTSDLNKPISTATQTALDGKVDKTTTANQIYGTAAANTQTTYTIDKTATANTVAQRDTNGVLNVGTPTANTNATTKLYVDNADALKVDKVNTASKVYGTDANGAQTTYDYDSFGKVDDVKVGTTSVVTNKIATLGTMAGEDKNDYATSTALQNEITRATDRETALNTNIQNEITRAQNAETGLQNSKADANNVYTKTEIDNMLTGAMHFKGSVATVADLQNIQNPAVGDMYNVTANGANYAWDGTQWVKMSETVDLSSYAQTSYVDQQDQAEATARQNADNLKVDKVTTPSRVYGTDELGQPITYGVSLFGNIDDVTVGGTSVVVNRVAPLGTMAGETASDYSTKAVADTLYAAKSLETTVSNHTSNTSNPHQVTKAQVGLGNVDNTSDLNKPISTATQTALDGKVSDVTVNGISVVTNKVAAVLVPVQSVNGDTGAVIIEEIKNQRDNSMTKVWEGTQAQYDAITTKDANTIYNIEGYDSIYEDLWDAIDTKQDKLVAGTGIAISGNIISSTVDISGKQDTITGAATTITSSDLTANRALISNSSGKVAVSSVTSTELGYVSGVTSSIQTQLNNKVSTVNTFNKIYGTDSNGAQTTYDMFEAYTANEVETLWNSVTPSS